MAQSAATTTSSFAGFLKPDEAEAYFNQARKNSSVMQLARKVPLGANGIEVPVVTSKASAGWVSEAGQKPTTEGAINLKTMKPHKIAAISVVSAEVVRANPGNYVTLLKDDIAEAFALAFDAATLHGTESPFDTYVDQTTKSVQFGATAQNKGGIYVDVVNGLSSLVNDKKKLTGFAFDRTAEPLFLSGTDANGRPLFVDTPLEETVSAVTPGRLIGRSAFIGDNIGTDSTTGDVPTKGIAGYAGDWSQAVWGVVGGITYDVSTQASVTINGKLVSLWENNLVAVRAEAEYGFLLNDAEAFVKYLKA